MAIKIVRKSIDLPDTVIKKLTNLGKIDKRRIKNYMEKVLIDHADATNKKKNDISAQ